jgi:hypothetical protein
LQRLYSPGLPNPVRSILPERHMHTDRSASWFPQS